MTIKSRFLIVLLVVGASAGLTVSLLAYRYSERALRSRVFNQLTSLRASRTEQIQSYLKSIEKKVATMSCDPSVVDAVLAYRAGVTELEEQDLSQPEAVALAKYYRDDYLPKLSKFRGHESLLESHFPQETVGQYLQYHYMLAPQWKIETSPLNELPPVVTQTSDDESENADGAEGEDNEESAGEAGEEPSQKKATKSLNSAEEEQEEPVVEEPFSLRDSQYQQTINRFDAYFGRVNDTEGFLDLFLIDPEDWRVVYSVDRGVDFATNLEKGPYSGSNLANVTRRALEESRCSFVVSDFDFYAPAYGTPSAFIASPIFSGTERVGVLAVDLPMDEINRIMTGGENWQRDGLGSSGEAYLVGSDKQMRSVSRFLLQEPEEYFATLEQIGVSPTEVARIRQTETTVLLQTVDTEATQAAAKGQSGTEVVNDYRGIPVLSSFAPLRLDEFDWYVLAEMDASEAFAPLYELRRALIISSAGMLLAITAIAMAMANLFTRPIRRFVTQARRVAAGTAEALSVPSGDEFGALAKALNEMIFKLKAATHSAENTANRLRRLLDDVLPEHMASRLSQGETELLDSHQNVTVLAARVSGIDEFVNKSEARDGVALLGELISELDEDARELGLDTVKSSGGDYTAICGASVPRLDHARRVVDFARLFTQKVENFNRKHVGKFKFSLGIDSGTAVTGMIGRQNLIYDVWGPAADRARRLNLSADLESSADSDESTEASHIVVSKKVMEATKDFYEYQPLGESGEFLLLDEKSES
ncbi:MAG: adenylate/guanylate cyclase domain-containing protein [Polyangiaceae bacterium]|nr:adenylate/guanylate cyclase domain-containing protein [Polyangiaceae bacterium]